MLLQTLLLSSYVWRRERGGEGHPAPEPRVLQHSALVACQPQFAVACSSGPLWHAHLLDSVLRLNRTHTRAYARYSTHAFANMGALGQRGVRDATCE
jgi:hypothetical protein